MATHSNAPRVTHKEAPERVKCDLCGLSFVSKFTLDSHHRLTHLNIRNFKCVICAEAFKSKKAYQLHQMRHSGEKPLR